MLSINQQALRHNYGWLTTRAPAAAVVKADAYGLGIVIVAPALHAAGCHEFFVAYPREGAALRQVLGEKPATIYVLNGFSDGTMAMFAKHSLTPVINTHAQLALLPAAWPLVLQVETGMHRSGIMDINAINRPVALLLSHLACADDPAHPLNARQLAAFRHIQDQLKPARASLAASSGILLGDDYHFDLTRPGIGLYGGLDVPEIRPVVTWSAPVLEVRQVAAGQTVGYSGTWTAPENCYIATLGAGYADGYPRALSNKGKVSINGVTVPIVGRVSMDLLTADVTTLVNSNGTLNANTATLYGDHYTINDAARDADTISYEILTRLQPRNNG